MEKPALFLVTEDIKVNKKLQSTLQKETQETARLWVEGTGYERYIKFSMARRLKWLPTGFQWADHRMIYL